MSASESPKAGKGLTSSSLSSLSFLVALQLFSRLFTSLLNSVLLRLASPSVFGTAAIQFELVLSTILFLSREGVRNAILRADASPQAEAKAKNNLNGKADSNQAAAAAAAKATNLTFLPFYIGLPLALATAVGYVAIASPETRAQPHLGLAVAIYALAALVELASEPMHNTAMVQLKTNVRVRAEGMGITCKSLTTLAVLVCDKRFGSETLPLVAFAAGQLVYSLVVFGYYAATLGVPWLAPRTVSRFSFDEKLLKLSGTMTAQSVVKHFLTEGDKVVLSMYSPLQDQGGYAIAVNYGSLIARIVFQPIEETLRVYFSKLLSSPSPSVSSPSSKKSTPANTSSSSSSSTSKYLAQAATALQNLLEVQLTVALLLIIFGRAYLPILLPAVLPPKYMTTNAPQILAAWVYYIPVLAVNGGLEAFMSSVAGADDVNRQSKYMVLFSALYVSSTIAFYRMGLGDVSLIYANIINLLARIAYCLVFADAFFAAGGGPGSPKPVKGKISQPSPPSSSSSSSSDEDTTQKLGGLTTKAISPPAAFVGCAGAAAALIQASARKFGVDAIVRREGKRALLSLHPRVIAHIGVGAALGLGCLAVWWKARGQGLVKEFKERQKESIGKVE